MLLTSDRMQQKRRPTGQIDRYLRGGKTTNTRTEMIRRVHHHCGYSCPGLILLLLVLLIEQQSCYCYINPLPLHRTSITNHKNDMNMQRQRRLTQQQVPIGSMSNTMPLSMTSTIVPTMLSNNNMNQIYRLGGMAGFIGLLFQFGLTKVFQRYTLTKDNAGYTAHTIVAFVFMTYVSIVGSIGWFSSSLSSISPIDRLLLPNANCQHLATIVTGLLLLWDLPTSMFIRSLRKIDVLIHHIIMTITSYFAATTIPMHYVFFYFGVSEISSIPLLLYDQLCVWTNANATKLENGVVNNETGIGPTTNIVPPIDCLSQWRDRLQIIAAISFTSIRAILFTYVTLRHFVPDTVSILARTKDSASLFVRPVQLKALRFALFASIGFTSLQLYWFLQMLQTIYKQATTSSKKIA